MTAIARSTTRKRERAAWGFVAPALIAIGVFFAIPVFAALLLSLTDFDIYALADIGNMRFVGLQNYERLFTNPLFWGAMKNTGLFAVLGVPLSIATSLGAAVILNARVVKWRPLWRVMFFAPYVTTLVATAVLWNYLLHTRYGVINWAISSVGLQPVDWLGDPSTSIPAILMFVVWKIFGYNMLIFYAALRAIPSDIYEAAAIDGATEWHKAWFIKLPALGPALMLAVIFSIIGSLQLFNEPSILQQLRPSVVSTSWTPNLYAYNLSFTGAQTNYAAAVAMLLGGFTVVIAYIVQIGVAKRGRLL